jgi:hypothetical protein
MSKFMGLEWDKQQQYKKCFLERMGLGFWGRCHSSLRRLSSTQTKTGAIDCFQWWTGRSERHCKYPSDYYIENSLKW